MRQFGHLPLRPIVLLACLLAGSVGWLPARADRAAQSPVDLWRKAVETYSANQDWYPERAAIRSEVRTGRKKLVSLTEMAFSLRPSEKGRLQVNLDRSRRNGVDTTEKMRSQAKKSDPLKRMALGDGTADSISIAASPFDPDRQKVVVVTPHKEKRTLAGRRCCRFDFTFRVGEGTGRAKVTWVGQAWIEDEGGRPVQMEFSITPLPRKFRRVRIVYDYEMERPDRWVVKSVTISGQGGFLFIKRLFTVTTTFSDFRQAPAAKRTP